MNTDIFKTVDAILDRITAADLLPQGKFHGCSETQLNALIRYINLPLPAAYRRVLEMCGHFEGWTFLNPWGTTESASYWAVLHLHSTVQNGEQDKNTSRVIPDNWLVFRRVTHPGHRFHCLDTSLGNDPPVFEVTGDFCGGRFGQPVQIAERFTDYLFTWVDEGINQRKRQRGLQNKIPIATPADFTGTYAQVFALLANIKPRPAMYIPGLQLANLETYLHGFEAGLRSQLPQEGEPFHLAFSQFIYERRGWSGNAGWAYAIREHVHHHERAWETFFELIEEFKASQER